MTTANTKDVFRWAIGKRIIGMYFEQREISGEVVVLVLSDGTGLAFGTGNGSHWTVAADDVKLRAQSRRRELERLGRDLRDVLTTEAALREHANDQPAR